MSTPRPSIRSALVRSPWFGGALVALLSSSALLAPIGADDRGSKGSPAAASRASEPSRGTLKNASDLEAALRHYEAEERAISEELDAVAAELSLLDERILSRGKAHYRNVHAGLLPAGSGFAGLVDHAARVEKNRMALVRDLDRQQALRNRQRELGDRVSRVKAERAPLEVHREEIRRAQAMLRAADERKAAFERAFETSTAPSDYVAIYGADTGPSDASSAAPGQSPGFAALMGRLPFPVAGRAEVRRLESRDGVGRAIELRSPAGATARSVAPGRVAFADRHDEHALTVILDHGDRYFTVYGQLERIDVKLGDSVPARSPLGPVATRQHEGSVLYFELRKRGRTVDPGPWLGL
jgi:septal ring factor EnvC (AmiA/AmiB activator)